jgi:hypothetical protein
VRLLTWRQRIDDDESAWEWFCLLELTRRGTVLAGAIEAQSAP